MLFRSDAAQDVPPYDQIRDRHLCRIPSFEDADAVNVKSFGAQGDGSTDDSEAFRRAIAAGAKVFVPKGRYRLSGTVHLQPDTHLFGLAPSSATIGAFEGGGRRAADAASEAFVLGTADAATARPLLAHLTVQGRIDWRSGQGDCVLAPGVLSLAGHGGGRFYGVMARGGPLILEGIRQPTSFYALNVERKGTNPQSQIRDCRQVRVFFFKVEAGTVNRPNAGDANTPCRIANSEDIRVYCMYGVVRNLVDRPMLEVVDSRDVLVAQLRTFSPGDFPHLVEVHGGTRQVIPSNQACALFVRH